jgi:uncharacterized damage-inducible protein DinB
MLERFRLLFQYELWANRRTLAAVEEASDRGPTVRLFAHILAAQQAWLTRLRGEDSTSVAIWPTSTLDDCRQTLDRLNGEIEDYLAGLDEAGLESPVNYRNQTGAEYTQTPLDILTHLGLHSQHHRGQIALQLRQLGQEPAVTDYIAFRREGDRHR